MPSIDNIGLDDPLVSGGDSSFAGGMVSATPPHQLAPGQYAYGQNVDHDNFGRILTRRGTLSTLGNTVSLFWEAEALTWNGSTKFWGSSLSATRIDATAYFETYATRYSLVAQSGLIYQGTETGAFTVISGATYSGSRAYFAQLNNRLYYCDAVGVLRYIDSAAANQAISAGRVTSIKITSPGIGYSSVPAMTFSSGAATATAIMGYGGYVVGATVTGAGSGYSASSPPVVTFAAPAGGTATATAIVNVSQTPSVPSLVTSHTNRLFCCTANTALPPDTVYTSDILDGESWDLAGGSFRVGGDGDPIVGLYSWFGNYLLVFKRRSIWVVNADPLIDVADWSIELVNNRIGCVSDLTIQSVGKDVFFLAQDGVRSLARIQNNTITDVSTPISAPVQDIIDGANRGLLGQSCATYYRNRYFLSIPSGTATTNSTTLVYNAVLEAWTSVWTGWAPWGYVITSFGGRPRMNFADNSGLLLTWDDATTPGNERSTTFRDGVTEIESFITTRAYDMGDPLVDKTGYMVELITENPLPDAEVTAYAQIDRDMSGTFTALSSAIALPASTRRTRRNFNLIPRGKWSVIQLRFGATRYRQSLTGVAFTGFSDNLKPELS